MMMRRRVIIVWVICFFCIVSSAADHHDHDVSFGSRVKPSWFPAYSIKDVSPNMHRRLSSLSAPNNNTTTTADAAATATANTGPNYETKYFTQILDHFNFNPPSYQTFHQRYLINDQHWGGNNSPIFVYMGNEGDIEQFAQNTGFIFDIAPRLNALVVFIELRYYGDSIPFGNNKKIAYSNASTLGYLSSTQALADYATLILDLKSNLTATESPVVVFGGSYGGMLAAWFRLKYPHITIGALASSAPILSYANVTSPYSFYDIITNDFKSVSDNCYRVIKGSWQQIVDTARQPGGIQLLRKSFKICENSNFSAYSLQSWLQTAYIYTAMTDNPIPSSFLDHPLPPYPVTQMCKAIDDQRLGNDTFAKLSTAANVFYNYSGTAATCFDLDNVNSALNDIYRPWDWQTCTELIMPVGVSEQSMFPAYQYNYSDDAAYCQRVFGTVPRSNWISTEFGGHDIVRVLKRFGSNIIFSNGLRDAWSGGGVLKDISGSILAIVAPQGAHHTDLKKSTPGDPKWLRNMRAKETSIISSWIKQSRA